MDSPPPLSQTCRICKQINFAAILTPREWDKDTGSWKPIFRPEWSGNGKTPNRERKNGRTKRTEPSEERLPQIRRAKYDELSLSTQSDQDGHESQQVAEVLKVVDTPKPPTVALAVGLPIEPEITVAGAVIDDEKGDRDLADKNEVVAPQDATGISSDLVGIMDLNSQEKPLESEQIRQESPARNKDGLVQGAQLTLESSNANPIHHVDRSGDQLKSPSELSAQDFKSETNENESKDDQICSDSLSEDENGDLHNEEEDDSEEDDESEGDNEEEDDGEEDNEDQEEDDDSDASASTRSSKSHLTTTQRIDLEKQAQGNWNYAHGQSYYLGSIWDLRSRRYECDLCWRLWRQTRRNPDIKGNVLPVTESHCTLKLMELKGRKTDGSGSEVFMLNLVYIYEYKLLYTWHGGWKIKMPFVLQGAHRDICDLRNKTPADQIVPFNDRLFGEGRWKKLECDYRLFREWLRVCETKHNHHIPKLTGEMVIRLIDVHKRCLIDWNGPTSEAPRFVTLSYVWGMSQQKIMLKADLLSQSKQPGFFNRPLDQTIQDAIDVVSRIGEKYLWIDCLCILQDSEEDKAIQIPQMNNIYGKAILTIVAGSGNSVDSGLPGVGKGSRRQHQFKLELDQIQVFFRGNTKIYSPPGSDIGFTENYLRSSIYQSRAWTFQEGRLSTRLLVFTKDQVYWECEKCTWCEDTYLESDTIDFISWRAVKNPIPDDEWDDKFERKAYDYPESEPPEPPRNSYAAIVKEYSKREMGDNKDVVDACMGVLSSIKEREQSDFIFALRTRHFGNDLLFNSWKAIPQRFPDQVSIECGFPTWSWTSWKGIIDIANEPRNNSYDPVENVIPCDGVKCYVLNADQHGHQSLRVLNETGGWQFRHDYVRVGEGVYDPTEYHIAARSSRKFDTRSYSSSSLADSVANSKPGIEIDTRSDPGSSSAGSVENSKPGAESENGIEASKSFSDLKEQSADVNEGSRRSSLHEDDKDSLQHQKRPTSPSETSAASETLDKSSEMIADIPTFSQDLKLVDIESHPAFSRIVPNFHIMFRTFSCIVSLRTEYDEWNILMGSTVIGGTKKTRAGGVWENRDEIQRKLYVCKKKPSEASSSLETDENDGDDEQHTEEPSSCPCCGKDTTPCPLPKGYELGPYVGRIPQQSNSWNAKAYMDAVPDGIYRLLWMNNNQLPMFGHLLCKPVSEPAPKDADWDGEILQRVSSVVGAPHILERKQQEKYAAEWGLFILG